MSTLSFPLARSRVPSLSSEGFQEMVGIVAERTTHGSNGLITSAYSIPTWRRNASLHKHKSKF